MKAIYDIKSNEKIESKKRLLKAAENLIQQGAEVIIAGCTEIPIVLKQEEVNFVVLDPSKILAECSIRMALEEKFVNTTPEISTDKFTRIKIIEQSEAAQ